MNFMGKGSQFVCIGTIKFFVSRYSINNTCVNNSQMQEKAGNGLSEQP
jgi:hypothetical protein